MNAGDDVQGGEDQSEDDGDEEDAESRRSFDDVENTHAVRFTDNVEEYTTAEDPPWITGGISLDHSIGDDDRLVSRDIPHERLVRSDRCIPTTVAVEESKVVGDLEQDGGNSQPECVFVD